MYMIDFINKTSSYIVMHFQVEHKQQLFFLKGIRRRVVVVVQLENAQQYNIVNYIVIASLNISI